MAWIYLAESADSGLPWKNGLGQLPTVKATNTLNPFFSQELPTDDWPELRYGTTCSLSAEQCCRQLTLFTEDSLARTLVLRDVALAWRESEADFSSRCSALQPKLERRFYSSKTCPQLELADFERLSVDLPIYGMTVGGLVSLPKRLEPRICEKDGFCLPTPAATSYGTNCGGAAGRTGKVRASLETMARKSLWPTPTVDDSHNVTRKSGDYQSLTRKAGGALNPTWVEWLMGYNAEWTVLEDWATLWFRSKRKSRSKD